MNMELSHVFWTETCLGCLQKELLLEIRCIVLMFFFKRDVGTTTSFEEATGHRHRTRGKMFTHHVPHVRSTQAAESLQKGFALVDHMLRKGIDSHPNDQMQPPQSLKKIPQMGKRLRICLR